MTLNAVSETIRRFFEDFERASNAYDGEYLAAQFGDPFMTANPAGEIQVARPEVIRAVTAQRRTFFQSAGLQSLTMTVLEDSALGERYRLARVQARMHFEKPDGEQLDVADISTYVLVTRDDEPRIVFYLTHGDFMALMRARGIMAG